MQALLAPSSADLTRVLLTNKPNGVWAQTNRYQQEVECVTTDALSAFSFQIGFAVHPDEPRLLEAVNAAIEVLTRAGALAREIERGAESLRRGGVEVEIKTSQPDLFQREGALPA